MIPNRIVVLGGSSVYGEGDPAGGGFVGRFRAWFEPRDPANRVFNLGVGGDTIGDLARRGPREVSVRRPELIVLYPGFNDIRRMNSPEGARTEAGLFRETLVSLFADLREHAPVVLLTGVPPDEKRTLPFRSEMYFFENEAAEIARIEVKTAAEAGVPCFDIFGTWSKKPDRRDLLIDGLHCNPHGYSILALELQEFLLRTFD